MFRATLPPSRATRLERYSPYGPPRAGFGTIATVPRLHRYLDTAAPTSHPEDRTRYRIVASEPLSAFRQSLDPADRAADGSAYRTDSSGPSSRLNPSSSARARSISSRLASNASVRVTLPFRGSNSRSPSSSSRGRRSCISDVRTRRCSRSDVTPCSSAVSRRLSVSTDVSRFSKREYVISRQQGRDRKLTIEAASDCVDSGICDTSLSCSHKMHSKYISGYRNLVQVLIVLCTTVP